MRLQPALICVWLATLPITPAWADGKKAASGHEPAAGTVWKEAKTGMEFVWVPSGCFRMGSTAGNVDERPVHKVCVQGFYLGKYEVTQAQYEQVMGVNPGMFDGVGHPVEMVSWHGAKNFAEAMSQATGNKVRLPSEAEWEYACRAGGAHQIYCGGGEQPDSLGWHDGNSAKKTHPAGELAANDWGLYDMSGNVWEWTQDCWNASYQGAPADGSAWESGDCDKRVIRGGAWGDDAARLRAASRDNMGAGVRDVVYGFRVARTLP